MHTNKATERQGLIKLLGLAVAGATLLAGMVALPVTKASAVPNPTTGLDTDDDFVAGALDDLKVPSLTVTKYLSSGSGAGAHGSVIDKPAAGVGTPAQGIVFNVKEVKAASGHSVADIDLNNSATFEYVDALNYYAGMTNGQGVISTWYTNDGSGKPTTLVKTFPAGVHYYVMTENRLASPAFTDGTIDSSRYQTSPDSLFGLPYKTTTPNGNNSGYIYHLHLYPKNVDSSSLSKVVTGTTDAGGNAVGIPVPGNYINYKVSQKIFNTPAVAGDGLLQVSEIIGAAPHLRVVDRMSPSLELDSGSVVVKVSWAGGNQALADTTDYTYNHTTTAPNRIHSAHTGDHFFPNSAGNANYHTFDFFNNPATITNLVASGGAAEGVGSLDIDITYRAKVTATGDNSASGGLANDVSSDNIDNPGGTLPGGHTSVPSGTAVFGKLKKNNSGNYDPLEGAVFRLTDPSDSAKYLASDGNYYDDVVPRPAGVDFYEATSSTTGVVAFTALPIMSPGPAASATAVAGNWDVIEYRSPAGFKSVSTAFSKVTFGSDVVGKNANQLISDFGTRPILADGRQLNFGAYAPTTAPSSPIQFAGQAVPKYMVNFAEDDNTGDAPASLPLTGGRGIVLLLVVGAAIMGGVLYIRSRRNVAQA